MLQNPSGWETSFTSWLENALAAMVGESHKGSHSKTKCWRLQCLPTGAQTYLRPHLGDFQAHSRCSCLTGQKVKRTAELTTQLPLLPLPWHWSKGRLTMHHHLSWWYFQGGRNMGKRSISTPCHPITETGAPHRKSPSPSTEAQSALLVCFKVNWLRKFLGSPVIKTLCFHCRGHRLDPWSGK